MPRDYRDIVIETLSNDIVATEAALVEALQGRDAYRLMARVAIEQVADLTHRAERQQHRICLLREEVRELRRSASSQEAA
jgi:hypothetical protein